MQILRACLATLLVTWLSVSHAEEEGSEVDEQAIAETQTSLRQQGQIEGYMTLPLADESIEATFISDKSGEAYGKVLILPDAAGNIDSRDLVHTLRLKLADSGWSTMTLNLKYPHQPQIHVSPATDVAEVEPAEVEVDTAAVAEAEQAEENAPETDNAARVAAAIAYLNAQPPGPIVIIALGQSANLATDIIVQAGDNNALIWINPQWQQEQAPETSRLLDIIPSVMNSQQETQTQRRAVLLNKDIEAYSQRQVAGATPGFYGFENYLFIMIRNWLHKHYAQGAEI